MSGRQGFALETTFDTRRFRSRTEARWAVFFKAMGWPYEYEREAFQLGGDRYLPDFWLPQMGIWWEVKGRTPTGRERALALKLQRKTNAPCYIAVGQPTPLAESIYRLSDEECEPNEVACALLADRRNPGEYWLAGDGSGWSIGPIIGPDHGRYPAGVDDKLRDAYAAALSERFGT